MVSSGALAGRWALARHDTFAAVTFVQGAGPVFALVKAQPVANGPVSEVQV